MAPLSGTATLRSVWRTLRRAFPYAVVVGVTAALLTAPSVRHLRTDTPTQTSFMRYRAEKTATNPVAGRPIALVNLPAVLVCAVVKAEDKRFFRHHGFDWAQVARAAGKSIAGESSFGASTITQQLARNLFLTPQWSIARKTREAIITTRLESFLSKRRILELYLNVIEWGDGVWGISAASKRYFQKAPDELNAFESTLLTGLIAAPLAAPSRESGLRVSAVQTRVLSQLEIAGIIDGETSTRARGRAALAQTALESGSTVDEAIARSRAGGAELPDVAPSIEEALADGCGLQREIDTMRRVREAQDASSQARTAE